MNSIFNIIKWIWNVLLWSLVAVFVGILLLIPLFNLFFIRRLVIDTLSYKRARVYQRLKLGEDTMKNSRLLKTIEELERLQ